VTVADIVISVAWKPDSLHYEVQYDTAVNWSVVESGVSAISLGEQSVNDDDDDDDENGHVGKNEKQQCEQCSKRCNTGRSVDVDVDRVRFLRC
jgi:hypothetical protein